MVTIDIIGAVVIGIVVLTVIVLLIVFAIDVDKKHKRYKSDKKRQLSETKELLIKQQEILESRIKEAEGKLKEQEQYIKSTEKPEEGKSTLPSDITATSIELVESSANKIGEVTLRLKRLNEEFESLNAAVDMIKLKTFSIDRSLDLGISYSSELENLILLSINEPIELKEYGLRRDWASISRHNVFWGLSNVVSRRNVPDEYKQLLIEVLKPKSKD